MNPDETNHRKHGHSVTIMDLNANAVIDEKQPCQVMIVVALLF